MTLFGRVFVNEFCKSTVNTNLLNNYNGGGDMPHLYWQSSSADN